MNENVQVDVVRLTIYGVLHVNYESFLIFAFESPPLRST